MPAWRRRRRERRALNVVIWRNDEEARDAAWVAGDIVVNSDVGDLPPFHGVPIPIKDLSEVAGWPVTYGSWSAQDTPSETSDLVVEALQRAGFVLTCRTNTPEFGLLTVAENDRYGISRNPGPRPNARWFNRRRRGCRRWALFCCGRGEMGRALPRPGVVLRAECRVER